ncbi:MAG: glycosyltransferase family A protein, partial [bacterium]
MENKISLIIPAYNEEKYIGDCLRSIFDTHKNSFFEIIVIDNASTDKTAEIASSFGVKVFHENQKGVVRARQRGYLEAKGDILAFVDADTLMPEGWLNIIKKEFEDANNVCVSGPYIYYDQSTFLKFMTKIYWYVLAMPVYKIVGYMAIAGNVAIKK